MALWQGDSRRKSSGGRRISSRGKRRYEIARARIDTNLGDDKPKHIRVKGGNTKTRMLLANTVNVTDPATGKTVRTTFSNVVENNANIHYVRRNIITKGAVVETKAGRVRITSRPGQNGPLNGVKVE